MANKKFLWGMLVIVLAFGMTVVGCEEKEDEPELSNATEIEVRGISGKTGTASISFWSTFANDDGIVAGGQGTISNEELSVSMQGLDGKGWDWIKDGGSYFVVLQFESGEFFVYTKESTFNELGISSQNDLHKLPKLKLPVNVGSPPLTVIFRFHEFKDISTLN